VFAALDRSFRILGGAPTYVLTDNEKTVTTAHVARVPVRNQQTLDFARHYGITVLTCQPADPATKTWARRPRGHSRRRCKTRG
jgi:transposase